jgi:hypothetical protein
VFTFSKAKAYKSTNYAGSWTALGSTGMIVSGAQLRHLGVAPSNVSVIGTVSSGGGASITTNGGTSWTSIGAEPDEQRLQPQRHRVRPDQHQHRVRRLGGAGRDQDAPLEVHQRRHQLHGRSTARPAASRTACR